MRGFVVASACCAVLLAPASAHAAGGVITANSATAIVYTGDGTANVLTVTTTAGAVDNVTFTETGISEGADPGGQCEDTGNNVVCDFTVGFNNRPFISGGDGNDRLVATGPVGVTLFGSDGGDELIGGAGADQLNGGLGADRIFGGAGDDTTFPGTGDISDLQSGRDVVVGETSPFENGGVVRGGSNVDSVVIGPDGGNDVPPISIDLAAGRASAPAAAGNPAWSLIFEGFENAGINSPIVGDTHVTNDVLVGTGGPNLLAGGAGNDTIVGGGGTDTLVGDRWLDATLGATNIPPATGADTILARDGFADTIDCGPGADVTDVDQFDGDREGCETARLVSTSQFGLPARDATAPTCKRSRLARRKRRTFLRRGFSFTFDCNEQARVAVTALVTLKRSRGKVRLSKAGDVVLAQRTFKFSAAKRTLRFKAARSVRRLLAKRFKVRLRIEATDRAGNRRASSASFSVR